MELYREKLQTSKKLETYQLFMEKLLKILDNAKITPKSLEAAQEKLDLLAKKYHDDTDIGIERYKLHQAQALIYFRKFDDENALLWMRSAVEVNGGEFENSSEFIAELEKDAPGSTGEPQAQFFTKSLWSLFLLSFFTLGIYEVYWFYKNWHFVKRSTGEKLSPFWRAWFTIFFTHSLFGRIKKEAKKTGYIGVLPMGTLATFYLIFALVSRGLDRAPDYSHALNAAGMVLAFVGALLLLPVQKVINYTNAQIPLEKKLVRRTSVWEIVIVVIGVLLFAISIFAFTTGEGGLNSQQQALKNKMDSLTASYELCSSELVSREPLVDLTNGTEVDDYNADLSSCEAVRLRQNDAVDEYNESIGY